MRPHPPPTKPIEQESEPANDRPVTPEMIQADRVHERRVIVAKSALDLVKRALLVVGQRHRSYFLSSTPVAQDPDPSSRPGLYVSVGLASPCTPDVSGCNRVAAGPKDLCDQARNLLAFHHSTSRSAARRPRYPDTGSVGQRRVVGIVITADPCLLPTDAEQRARVG